MLTIKTYLSIHTLGNKRELKYAILVCTLFYIRKSVYNEKFHIYCMIIFVTYILNAYKIKITILKINSRFCDIFIKELFYLLYYINLNKKL